MGRLRFGEGLVVKVFENVVAPRYDFAARTQHRRGVVNPGPSLPVVLVVRR